MKLISITGNLSRFLLAIYFIINGLSGTFGFSLGALSILVPLLALVIGLLILFGM